MAPDDPKTTQDDFHIGIGWSIKKNIQNAVAEATQQAWERVNSGTIDLAVLFTTPSLTSQETIGSLNLMLGDTPLIGCSSSVLLTPEGFLTHGLALMLIALPKGIFFNTASLENVSAKPAHATGEELGNKMLYGFKEVRKDLALFLVNKITADTTHLVPGIQEQMGKSFPITGACPCDTDQPSPAAMYCNRTLSIDTICGIAFGGKLNFGLGSQHGWKPLGKPRRVTRSRGTTAYEIDGRSAAEMYKHYFSCDLKGLQKELKTIATYYPIGVFLAEQKEYLLRSVTTINDDGSLMFQGDIPEHSLIRLMIATQESCLEATRLAAEEAVKSLHGETPKFMLVFESISRYMLLGRMLRKEIATIKKHIGEETPFLGICTNAELAPLKSLNYLGETHFHNHMVTFLTFGVTK